MCPEELFLPVHDWLEEYFETYENTQLLLIKVKSPCMAITSSVCFRNLLEICEEANLKGKAIQLNWYINEGINDREIKCIEHFQETVTFPFQLIKY